MIKFVIDFLDDNVIIQTKKHSYIYDNAKNAAESVFDLLQGYDNLETSEGEEYIFSVIVRYNQDDMFDAMKNSSKYKNESDSLFIQVFFEELHLAWYVRGGCNE